MIRALTRATPWLLGGLALPHPLPGPGALSGADEATRRRDVVVTVAHRGGIVAGYPENTLATFRRAIELGVDMIELDLRATRDGVVVVIHDAIVDRTTDGTGRVATMDYARLARLDAGGGERIPAYRDVLALVAEHDVGLVLDLKRGGRLDPERVVSLTARFGAIERTVVGVRRVEDLRAYRALAPSLRTLALLGGRDEIDAFLDAGVHAVRLWPRWIEWEPALVRRIQRRGAEVWTTAGDSHGPRLRALLAKGVDGILHDRPEVLLAAASASAPPQRLTRR